MRNLWLKILIVFGFLCPLSLGIARAGEVNLVGTGDGLDILRAIAQAFEQSRPGARVLVPPSIGSGGAIAAVGADRERIGRIARALTQNEIQSGLVAVPVVELPSAFYVHPEIGEVSLSSDQIADIFAGRATSWRSLGGADIRIRVVRREDADSTLLVLRSSLPQFRDLRLTDRSKLAMTTQEAFESIRDNPGAIGFGPFSALVARSLPVVRLDGKLPLDDGYPVNATLSLIYKEERIDDEIRAFIRFFATERARGIIRSFGARPIAR